MSAVSATVSSGNAPPWARLYPDPLTGCGHFGVNGPQTEQFAIGLLLHCMTRGHEPYELPNDGPERDVVVFSRRVFSLP